MTARSTSNSDATAAATGSAAAPGPDYPPAPWELYGQAQMHLLTLRAGELPQSVAGFKPLVLGGRAFVLAGWIDYEGGSVLSYHELFAAVIGFGANARRPTATVTHMWVDSEASRRGGRELWGYPKQLAEFVLQVGAGGSAATSDEHGEIATGALRPWVRSPRQIGLRGGTVQPLGGVLSPVRALIRGTPVLGGGTFEAAPAGALGFLSGAHRLLSFGLRDFHFTFGI